MVSAAKIASRSSIAIDLKMKGKRGTGAYDLSVLNDMKQLLGELLILRDSGEKPQLPEMQVIGGPSSRRLQVFFNKAGKIAFKEEWDKVEWATQQVRKVQGGDFSSASELSLYLTTLSGLLLTIN